MTIEISELTRIDLKPGEYLAVHLPESLAYPSAEISRIKGKMREIIPELSERIIIVQGGIRLEAINPNA